MVKKGWLFDPKEKLFGNKKAKRKQRKSKVFSLKK